MGIKTDERVVQYLKKKIAESTKIVVVVGMDALVETGGLDYFSNEHTYRIEEKYGYSPEDIFTTSFYNSKVEKFYNFYKKEVLNMRLEPGKISEAIFVLQKKNKLLGVINQNYLPLPDEVFFKKVININGSIMINKCPRCNEKYNLGFIKKSSAIPLCERCKVTIRPEIRLIGERVDAIKMAEVANICEEADVLLVLGKDHFDEHLEYNADPEKEQLKVLFCKEDYVINGRFDYIIHDDIQEILPYLVQD